MPPWNSEPEIRREVSPNGMAGSPGLVGEHVVLPLIHKHWIVLAKGLLLPAVAGGVLLILLVAHGGGLAPSAVLLSGIGVVAGWVWLGWAVATVRVTTERVIIKEGVLVRTTKVIPLNRVQDVSTRQNLFGQVLGYGSLEIDTAGRIENEVVTHLPTPERLREEVFVLLDRFRRGPDLGI